MLKNQRKIKGMDKYYKLFPEYNNKSRIRISILKIDNSNRTLFKYYDSKYDKLHLHLTKIIKYQFHNDKTFI